MRRGSLCTTPAACALQVAAAQRAFEEAKGQAAAAERTSDAAERARSEANKARLELNRQLTQVQRRIDSLTVRVWQKCAAQ